MVVIASVDPALVGAGLWHLDGRGAPEFATPNDEGLFQEAAHFEILEEGGDGLVALPCEPLVVFFQIVVVVPGLSGPVPDLHEAHAPLDQAPRDEHLPALGPGPVHPADFLRFPAEIEGISGFHLHAVSEFERLQARFEPGIVLSFPEVAIVDLPQEIELSPLAPFPDLVALDVFDELAGISLLRIDVSALEDPRQEGRLPILCFLDRESPRAHGDEAGQVLVLGAEPVGDPRAHGGPHQSAVATVHEEERGLVIRHVGVHGTDHAEIVRHGPDVRKQFGDLQAALAIVPELEWRLPGGPGGTLGPEHLGQFLAVQPGEFRFGIEGVEVRRSAIHEEVNDVPGLAGELGRSRSERVEPEVRIPGSCHQPGDSVQGHRSHSHSAARQELAPGEEEVLGIDGVMLHGRSEVSPRRGTRWRGGESARVGPRVPGRARKTRPWPRPAESPRPLPRSRAPSGRCPSPDSRWTPQ